VFRQTLGIGYKIGPGQYRLQGSHKRADIRVEAITVNRPSELYLVLLGLIVLSVPVQLLRSPGIQLVSYRWPCLADAGH
jgi:hypothetical protein